MLLTVFLNTLGSSVSQTASNPCPTDCRFPSDTSKSNIEKYVNCQQDAGTKSFNNQCQAFLKDLLGTSSGSTSGGGSSSAPKGFVCLVDVNLLMDMLSGLAGLIISKAGVVNKGA